MGRYDIRLSDWTLLFWLTSECSILFGNAGDVAHTSAERQRTPGWLVAAAWLGTRTVRSFCVRCFEQTFSRPLDWLWLTDIFGTIAMASMQSWPYHTRQFVVGYYQGKSGCVLLQQQQRRFAHSCGRRLSHNYSKNAPTYVTEDKEAHPFVCSASRCTYGFTGHVTKAYVSDSSQIMLVYWLVYGNFLPTLYNTVITVAQLVKSVEKQIQNCHTCGGWRTSQMDIKNVATLNVWTPWYLCIWPYSQQQEVLVLYTCH